MKHRTYHNILLNSMFTLFKEGWQFIRGRYSTIDKTLSFRENEVQPYSDVWNDSEPELCAFRSQIRDLHSSRLEFEYLYKTKAPRNADEARELLGIAPST